MAFLTASRTGAISRPATTVIPTDTDTPTSVITTLTTRLPTMGSKPQMKVIAMINPG